MVGTDAGLYEQQGTSGYHRHVPPDDLRSDDALIAGCNAGDTDAFDSLYRRHRDWVLRLARRFTQDDDDALDVLQDTFAHLLRQFPGFELRARLTTYLYPTVKHLALTRRRRRRREAAADPSTLELPAPASASSSAAQRAELAAVLAALPDARREMVLMRFIDDLTLEQIAQALQIPLGTAKSRLFHAVRALREDPRTRRYFDVDSP